VLANGLPAKKHVPQLAAQPVASVPKRVVNGPAPRLPPNVKLMHGVPWALDELPRQMRSDVNGQMPQGDIFGGPPPPRRRKQQTTKPALDTITERPKVIRLGSSPLSGSVPQVHIMSEGSGSDTDHDSGANDLHPDPAPKKVQKGQINALAKMLSALKTNRARD